MPIPRSRVTRFANIQRNSSQQISVTHLSQQLLPTLIEQVTRQAGFRFNERIDFLFNRTTTHKLVDEHIAMPPDAKGAVGGLILHGRIPPAVEVNHLGGSRQIQSGAASLER